MTSHYHKQNNVLFVVNLDHTQSNLGGLEEKIGRSGSWKKSKFFETFEKSQNVPKMRQRSQFAAEMYFWGEFVSYMVEFGRSGGT